MEFSVDVFTGDTEEPEIAELPPQCLRKFIVAVDLGGMWREFTLREIADGLPQHVRGVAESEIQGLVGGADRHAVVAPVYMRNTP